MNFFFVLKEMLYFCRLLHKSSRENRKKNYFSGEGIRVDFRMLRILPNDFVLTTSFSTTARCILLMVFRSSSLGLLVPPVEKVYLNVFCFSQGFCRTIAVIFVP